MPPSPRVCEISASLFTAPAERVLDALHAGLAEHFGATGATMLLVDYRTTMLRPLGTERPPEAIDSSTGGRVFAAQQPWSDEKGRVLLPVTARGRRLGVLEVLFGAPPAPGVLGELAELAALSGCALHLADRETERFARARRAQRLTLPAEIQWDLLPAGSHVQDGYELGAQLEPAYAVAGDNFDWAADGNRLTITVTNGMGTGIQAAMLTALAVGALRNARRSGADLAEQAGLANDAVHARYGGREFVETLLLQVDTRTGEVAAIDAGSPWLLRSPGGARNAEPFERVPLEQQLPLGMFSETAYVPQPVRLEPGDRLLAVSDGLHGALSPDGERFSDRLLDRTARATRRITACEAARALVRALIVHHDGTDLGDDAVVLCLDRVPDQEPRA
jgi:serine phosphatase RsbU (regulator of sigma subunit)